MPSYFFNFHTKKKQQKKKQFILSQASAEFWTEVYSDIRNM